jgi:hypothetical protein
VAPCLYSSEKQERAEAKGESVAANSYKQPLMAKGTPSGHTPEQAAFISKTQ